MVLIPIMSRVKVISDTLCLDLPTGHEGYIIAVNPDPSTCFNYVIRFPELKQQFVAPEMDFEVLSMGYTPLHLEDTMGDLIKEAEAAGNTVLAEALRTSGVETYPSPMQQVEEEPARRQIGFIVPSRE